MPSVSRKQARWWAANRKKMEAKGYNVDEWLKVSGKVKKHPKKK